MLQIKNPLKMHNWDFKSFFAAVLIIQLLFLITIYMDSNYSNIGFLRQILGFFYLTFIPGFVILRILKLHDLDTIKILGYVIGLSIATLIISGFLWCLFAPLIGITKPLSFYQIISLISVLVFILLIVSYFRDRKYNDNKMVDLRDYISPTSLFLCLIPFLSIFGTYLINNYYNNILILFLLLMLGLIIILIAFNKISKKYYALSIFVISFSLLLQNTLVSMYIGGYDIQREYYVANYISNVLYWSPAGLSIDSIGLNSLLSITVLPTMYSKVLNLNLIWVFKIIYPFMLSLVPLLVYEVFKNQIDQKIAFLSTIYFVSIYCFFYNMTFMLREIVAELFLVLVILILIDDKKGIGKSLMLVIFSFSLIVSHYGIAYLLVILLLTSIIILFLLKLDLLAKLKNKFKFKSNTLNYESNITINFVLLFIIIVTAWYSYVSHSFMFDTIINTIHHIIISLSEFLDPTYSQGINIIVTTRPTLTSSILKYLYLITQIFTGIGLIVYFILPNYYKEKFNTNYLLMAIASFLLCVMAILIPNFGVSMDSIRIYQFALIFLAPFSVIGGIFVFNKLMIVFKNDRNLSNNAFKIFSIFLVIFLLFNTGFFQEIAHERYIPSMSLSSANDPPIFNEKELASARWITKFNNGSQIYSDVNGFVLLNGFIGSQSRQMVFSVDEDQYLPVKNGTYIYLRINTIKGFYIAGYDENGRIGGLMMHERKYMDSIIAKQNQIYDDGSIILN